MARRYTPCCSCAACARWRPRRAALARHSVARRLQQVTSIPPAGTPTSGPAVGCSIPDATAWPVRAAGAATVARLRSAGTRTSRVAGCGLLSGTCTHWVKTACRSSSGARWRLAFHAASKAACSSTVTPMPRTRFPEDDNDSGRKYIFAKYSQRRASVIRTFSHFPDEPIRGIIFSGVFMSTGWHRAAL